MCSTALLSVHQLVYLAEVMCCQMSPEIWKGTVVLGCVGFLLQCSFGRVGKGVEEFKIGAPGFKHLISLKYHYQNKFKIM